jgi:hypothetical protein
LFAPGVPRVAQKVLPITLRAMSRLNLGDGLENIGAVLQNSPDVNGTTAATALHGADISTRKLTTLLVVMTWDYDAQSACLDLQEEGYGHECVQVRKGTHGCCTDMLERCARTIQ